MLTYILFILGFPFLIKGADILVHSASSISKHFNISRVFIGLTLVAFTTSMPEFVITLIANFQGNSDIAIANNIGSNIINILLILGISAIIIPLPFERHTLFKELPISIGAAIVLFVLGIDTLQSDKFGLTRIDGLILVFLFAMFLYYTTKIFMMRDENTLLDSKEEEMSVLKAVLFIPISLAAIVFGGNWIVNGAAQIAEAFGLSNSFIGLTIVTIGASLPELATSTVAAYRKKPGIAIGNLIGSNIFNILWIVGFASTLKPLAFSQAYAVDILVIIAASFFIFIALALKRDYTLTRVHGIFLVGGYIAYIVFLFIRG